MKFRSRITNVRCVSYLVTTAALASAMAGALVSLPLHGQSAATSLPAQAASGAASPGKRDNANHYQPTRFPKRAKSFYSVVWGIDSLSVKAVESGALLRFSYRVLDPAKAKVLNDKKVDAFLDSPKEGVRLTIPSLEKVGQLRQATTEEEGKTYWMAFSNPRRTVKRGDHINIVIGSFHADGLLVD